MAAFVAYTIWVVVFVIQVHCCNAFAVAMICIFIFSAIFAGISALVLIQRLEQERVYGERMIPI
jgi:cell division protein FtsB